MGFFAFILVAALGVLALVTALQWRGGERRPMRGDRGVGGAGPSPAQLDRLESALRALEARVDDLQEQQRFLERLVAERPERGALPGPTEESEEAEGILFDTEPSEE